MSEYFMYDELSAAVRRLLDDQFTVALEGLEQVLAKMPDNLAALGGKGILFIKSGQPHKALECLEQARALLPGFSEYPIAKGLRLIDPGSAEATRGAPVSVAPNSDDPKRLANIPPEQRRQRAVELYNLCVITMQEAARRRAMGAIEYENVCYQVACLGLQFAFRLDQKFAPVLRGLSVVWGCMGDQQNSRQYARMAETLE